MSLYIVAEGIVSHSHLGACNKTENCIDPFDGAIYEVGEYKGGLNLNNFSDWNVFDCSNACEALLLSVGCSESLKNRNKLGRLARKVEALRSIRDWVLSGGKTAFTPNRKQSEWLPVFKRSGIDPYDLGPLEWLEVAEAVPYTTSPRVLIECVPGHIKDYLWERVGKKAVSGDE